MERTTTKQLENLLRQLQAVTNTPMGAAWVRQPDGTLRATPNTLVLDGNIGGYRVEQIFNDGGGITTSLGESRYTKGELWHALKMAINAVRLALGEAEFHIRMRRAYPDEKAA